MDIERMNGHKVNFSTSALGVYLTECYTYKDNDGTSKLGPPSAGIIILYITFSFEFLVGTPSNVWLVRHILRRRSKVTGVLPADFFPLHLALTQLLFYLIIPLLYGNNFLWKSEYVDIVMVFMTSAVLFLKPLLLCMVCVESYMAVVRPLDYLRFKEYHYRWGCLGFSWCIYVLMGSLSVLKRSTVTVSVLYLPVLVIDTFCCLRVLKTLQKPPPGDNKRTGKEKKKEEKRKTHKNVSEVVRMEGKQEQGRMKEEREEEKVRKVERSEPSRKGEMNSMKKKAFVTIVIIQAVLTLNYLPIIISLLVKGFVSAKTMKCQFQVIGIAAAASCSYLQPLLYLHRLRRLPCMMPKNT